MVLVGAWLQFKQRNQPSTVRQLQLKNISRKKQHQKGHESPILSKNASGEINSCTCTPQHLHHVTFKHRYMESHMPQPKFNSPARVIPDILHPVEYVKGGRGTRSEYIYRRIHTADIAHSTLVSYYEILRQLCRNHWSSMKMVGYVEVFH